MRLILCLTLFLLSGCEDEINKRTPVKLWIGNTIESVKQELGAELSSECDADLCWYRYRKPTRSGDFLTLILGGKKAFDIQDVFAFSVPVYKQDANKIELINLSPVGPPEDSKHSDAESEFYTILAKLQASGWKRYIRLGEPRVPGTEIKKFNTINEVLGKPVLTGPWTDPAIRLSNEMWRSMPLTNDWFLYRDNEYLTLSVQRENSDSEPLERGTYLFTLTFKSEKRFFSEYFDYADRERLAELLPDMLKKLALQREVAEERLMQSGICIDQRYQNPEIKLLY